MKHNEQQTALEDSCASMCLLVQYIHLYKEEKRRRKKLENFFFNKSYTKRVVSWEDNNVQKKWLHIFPLFGCKWRGIVFPKVDNSSSPIVGKHFYYLPLSLLQTILSPSIFIFSLLSKFYSKISNKGKQFYNSVFPWKIFLMEIHSLLKMFLCLIKYSLSGKLLKS